MASETTIEEKSSRSSRFKTLTKRLSKKPHRIFPELPLHIMTIVSKKLHTTKYNIKNIYRRFNHSKRIKYAKPIPPFAISDGLILESRNGGRGIEKSRTRLPPRSPEDLLDNSLIAPQTGNEEVPQNYQYRTPPPVTGIHNDNHTQEKLESKLSETEEPLSEYKKGGYCPIFIGETIGLGGTYQILRKLGWGRYSTVWLVHHRKQNKYFALKILKAAITSWGLYEREILQQISDQIDVFSKHPGVDNLPRMIKWFWHSSPSGNHICLVMELLGPSVHDVLNEVFLGGCMPPILLKVFGRDVLNGLDFLHERCGIIHLDLVKENIFYRWKHARTVVETYLHQHPLARGVRRRHFDYVESENLVSTCTVKYIDPVHVIGDFGSSCWSNKHILTLHGQLQPRRMRAPEMLLKAGWDQKVDIWNFGLLMHELSGFGSVFDGKTIHTKDGHIKVLKEYDILTHLDQIIAFIGNVPQSLRDQVDENERQLFNQNGSLVKPYRNCKRVTLPSIYKSSRRHKDYSGPNKHQVRRLIQGYHLDILELLFKALRYPARRYSAHDLLNNCDFLKLEKIEQDLSHLIKLKYFNPLEGNNSLGSRFSIISFHFMADSLEHVFQTQTFGRSADGSGYEEESSLEYDDIASEDSYCDEKGCDICFRKKLHEPAEILRPEDYEVAPLRINKPKVTFEKVDDGLFPEDEYNIAGTSNFQYEDNERSWLDDALDSDVELSIPEIEDETPSIHEVDMSNYPINEPDAIRLSEGDDMEFQTVEVVPPIMVLTKVLGQMDLDRWKKRTFLYD